MNATTEFTYDAIGNILSVTDAKANTTTMEYDALNRLTKTISPAPFNYQTKYTYDKNNNLIKLERQKDAAATQWQLTEYEYDNLDQLILTKQYLTDLDVYTTQFEYDGSQNRTKIIDAENKQTNYVYDERGLLYTVTDAENNITTYNYDDNGNLEQIQDAKANTTDYEYDDFNRLIKTIYPDTSFEQFSYDKNSNLKTKRTRKGDTIQYSYDELNRIKTRTYPNSTAVNYSYDIASRLMSVTSHTSQVTSYDYDNLNRVTQTTQTVNSVPYILNYEYDSLGNRTKLTYPDNTYVTYEYDQLNRLKKLMANGSSLIAEYTYDELSRRTQLDYANTTQTTYQYDNLNRLTDIGRTQGTPLHYEYDKVGNRKTMTVDSTDVHSYTYDNIYQLTNVDYPANSTFSDTTYNYDDLGNRESVVSGTTTNYTPNNLNQYTDIDNGQGLPLSLQYDFNGNLLNDENNTYEYDYENRLTKAITADNIIEYAYDAFGRRTEKNIFDTNRYQLNAIRYVYDGDQVIGEYDASGSLLRKYVYGTGIDEPIQVTRHTTQDTFYYHFDGLGSVVALTDSSGATVESYEYDVYGNSLILDANRQTLTASQIGNSYMFTGRRFDTETGLYYYRARYYNSELGRFLQTDPIGYYGGINLYSYCANNPVRFVDPEGKAFISTVITGIVVIITVGYILLRAGRNAIENRKQIDKLSIEGFHSPDVEGKINYLQGKTQLEIGLSVEAIEGIYRATDPIGTLIQDIGTYNIPDVGVEMIDSGLERMGVPKVEDPNKEKEEVVSVGKCPKNRLGGMHE